MSNMSLVYICITVQDHTFPRPRRPIRAEHAKVHTQITSIDIPLHFSRSQLGELGELNLRLHFYARKAGETPAEIGFPVFPAWARR